MKPSRILVITSVLKWTGCITLASVVLPCVLFPLALVGPYSSIVRILFYRVSATFSQAVLAIFGIRYTVNFKECLNKLSSPAIIVMNHSSALDIPILEATLAGHSFVWFSKASYTAIPFAGAILQRMHAVLDRKKPSTASRSLDYLITKAGRFSAHILIFPEGTRSVDGKLNRFKPGFALAAEQTGRPVVPIVAYGLHNIMPKHSFLIDSSDKLIKIEIGAPITREPDELREVFIQRVHAACATLLSQISDT